MKLRHGLEYSRTDVMGNEYIQPMTSLLEYSRSWRQFMNNYPWRQIMNINYPWHQFMNIQVDVSSWIFKTDVSFTSWKFKILTSAHEYSSPWRQFMNIQVHDVSSRIFKSMTPVHEYSSPWRYHLDAINMQDHWRHFINIQELDVILGIFKYHDVKRKY